MYQSTSSHRLYFKDFASKTRAAACRQTRGLAKGYQGHGPYLLGKVDSILVHLPFISCLSALLLAESPHLVHRRDFSAR